MTKGIKPGTIIKAGTLVLLTSGEYSSYGVNGLFRAKTDITVPGMLPHPTAKEQIVDVIGLSIELEEIPYVEVHDDQW